jgi:hypothetical protein
MSCELSLLEFTSRHFTGDDVATARTTNFSARNVCNATNTNAMRP